MMEHADRKLAVAFFPVEIVLAGLRVSNLASVVNQQEWDSYGTEKICCDEE
jgi:hypothetical protein